MSSLERVQFRRRLRVWADALTYAFALTAIVGAGCFALGFATGGGAVRAKELLFVVGWLLLAYATVRLWPSSPAEVDSGSSSRFGPGSGPDTRSATASRSHGGAVGDRLPSTRFQTFVQSLPPVRWIQPPAPEHRLTPPGKVLVGSLLILLLSFLLETVFGIA
ncbi:DUF7555 family protein [Halopiger aswanensis]|uniref:Uncharacterized protein n=1 Tax=Halopiger aswanensis TaxID=148449 RepID=A0A419WIS7_9EURY|nr:hypothetical protein [Halopiger aswanensis]RKD95373.1 hypothetical protein ATJ93_2225 [Halopiger aswanensis]